MGRRMRSKGKVLAVTVLTLFVFSLMAAPASALSSDGTYLDLFMNLLDYMFQNYHGKINLDDVWRGAMNGMIDGMGDPYSDYLTAKEYAQLSQSLSGEYSGIGVTVEAIAGEYVVVAPMPGGPAERAGIMAQDVITQVDGVNVSDLSLADVAARLRGDAGTSVSVTVRRQGKEIVYRLVREPIRPQNIRIERPRPDVAVVRINEFTSGTGQNLAAALAVLRDQGVKGIVLDLRNNPGGYVSEALQVMGLFVKDATGVQLETNFGTEQWGTGGDGSFADLKLVTLVNEGTASAAEIVAAGLQDYGVALVVGSRTFGKGVVQSFVELSNGDAVKFTIAEYLSPLGHRIDHVGVKPNVEVAAAADQPPVYYRYNQDLQIGAVALDVLNLEQALLGLGLNPGKVDGYYDSDTALALIRVQEKAGLPETGILNEATAQALNAQVRAKYESRPDVQLERALAELQNRMAGLGN